MHQVDELLNKAADPISEGSGGLLTTPSLPTLMEGLSARNRDILSVDEQLALHSMRICVAGCGSVGGAVVEPLARLGVSSFVLADPDIYDLTNLNRQAAYLADIGQPKVEVLRKRVLAVNPFASVATFTDGLTEENLSAALEGATCIFDGVDPQTSLWVKYLFHAYAAQHGIPVVVGGDYGGKPTVYVFDYRRDPRPFYGKAREADFRDGNFSRAMKWVGIRPFATDFAPVVADRLTTGEPWPQIVYCVLGMGALASRALIDVAMQRRVPNVISIDLHMATRRRRARAWEHIRWPNAIAKASRASRAAADPSKRPAASDGLALVELPAALLPLAQAVRLGPSLRNAQPWTLSAVDEHTIEFGMSNRGAPVGADPRSEFAYQGLGCAIEAATSVLDCEIEPAEAIDRLASGALARLRIHGARADYVHASAVLGQRRTNRGPYALDPPLVAFLAGCSRFAEATGAQLAVVDGPQSIGRLADVVRKACDDAETLRASFDDLVGDIRFSRQELEAMPIGYRGNSLALPRSLYTGLRLASTDAIMRNALRRFGAARLLRRHTADLLQQSGALLILCPARATPSDNVAVGRTLMRIWLSVTELGLGLHPIAFARPPAEFTEMSHEALGSVVPGTPILIARIGRPQRPAGARDPRLPLARICRADVNSPDGLLAVATED